MASHGRVALVGLFAALLALGADLARPGAAAAKYLAQERIPTDHPIYRDLERLIATYDRTPTAFSTRPIRVQEILAFLNSLVVEMPSAVDDPAYIRARRHVDRTAPGAASTFMKIQDDSAEVVTLSPYASLVYEEDPRNRPDLRRDYRVGLQIAAALDSNSFFYFDGYGGTASQGGRGTPNFGRLNAVIEGVDLNSCMDEAYGILQMLATPQAAEAVRLAGELHAELHFGRLERIFGTGLHEYLTGFLDRITTLGGEINRGFFTV